MEQKRFFAFLGLSLAFIVTWQVFIVPRFLPQQKPAPPPRQPAAAAQAQAPREAERPPIEAAPSAPGAEQAVQPALASRANPHPLVPVKLGSIEAETGYRLEVTLTSQGAAVKRIRLNDPRYRELTPPHDPLTLVNQTLSPDLTFQTSMPQFGEDLRTVHWEVMPDKQSAAEATFRIVSLDGALELRKRYFLSKVDPAQADEFAAYELGLEFTIHNRGEQPRTAGYVLQGPVGLPLENIENTAKFRDVVVGFQREKGGGLLGGDGTAEHTSITAKTIAEGKIEEWRRPVQYIGVDVQYFAALIIPEREANAPSFIRVSQPVLERKADPPARSDISVTLTSADLELSPAGKPESDVTHRYRLFAGPKRDELLAHLGAPKVLEYGSFDWISRPMLWLMTWFYGVFHSYGIAIICLTVVVRACLLPISLRQARTSLIMQEAQKKLQPEMAALKVKYANEPAKLQTEMFALYRKYNVNPFAMFGGCLLVMLQLPIFTGLYQALSHSVDLRMAKFLYIQNLAAPDALFPLPFRLPFVGWNEFNLLPILTIVLFMVQQKMLMPPPTTDEQAQQQKVMSFMTVFMGFLFYKVPSGLCIYFIASSLWGLAERKLLPKPKLKEVTNVMVASPKSDAGEERTGVGGLLERLLKAADKEVAARKGPDGRRR